MRNMTVMRAQNAIFTPKPASKPKWSLQTPITQGPSAPPAPANANRTPKIVPMFSLCKSETAAIIVGKMMEKNNPVNGMKITVCGVPKIPTATQTTDDAAAYVKIFR